MWNNLPEDIVHEILLKLPFKNLIQCTAVCKSWYTLITSSTFISTHATLSNNNTHLLLLRRHPTSQKAYFSLHFDNENLEKCQDLEYPFETYTTKYDSGILEGCNGLVCLYNYYSGYFSLWNPAIRRCLKLPKPLNEMMYGCFHGFGFDSKSNDYKVVRLVYVVNKYPFAWNDLPSVQVYSLKAGSWRDIQPNATVPFPLRSSSDAFLNGALHWVAGVLSKGRYSDEVFRTWELPGDEGRKFDFSIFVFGGLLALFGIDGKIWIMKEYGVVESWTHQFTIDTREDLLVPLCVRKNGEILFRGSGGELVSYDLKRQACNATGMFEISNLFNDVDSYRECLVLLDKTNVVVSNSGAKNNSKKRHALSLN